MQWPFITHNKDWTEDLLTLLHNFQTLLNPITLTIHNSKGIHGTLLDEISEIINLFNKQPFHNKSYLCSLGSYNSGSIRLSYRILHILISGIQFHHKLSPANFRPPNFNSRDSWLTDEHLEIIRLGRRNNISMTL